MSILERVLVSDHWLHIQFTQVQLRTLKSKEKEIGVLAMESISKFSSGVHEFTLAHCCQVGEILMSLELHYSQRPRLSRYYFHLYSLYAYTCAYFANLFSVKPKVMYSLNIGTCANFITCLSIVSSISCRRMNLTYMKIEYKKEANSFK
ncbi:hypothetical protein LXL04_021890 [Taraxacum kok-saghyz]